MLLTLNIVIHKYLSQKKSIKKKISAKKSLLSKSTQEAKTPSGLGTIIQY